MVDVLPLVLECALVGPEAEELVALGALLEVAVQRRPISLRERRQIVRQHLSDALHFIVVVVLVAKPGRAALVRGKNVRVLAGIALHGAQRS